MDHLRLLDDACDEIDASVFSGELLQDDEQRKLFKEYVERWARAIKQHEDSQEDA